MTIMSNGSARSTPLLIEVSHALSVTTGVEPCSAPEGRQQPGGVFYCITAPVLAWHPDLVSAVAMPLLVQVLKSHHLLVGLFRTGEWATWAISSTELAVALLRGSDGSDGVSGLFGDQDHHMS